jgi:serine/threonine protein phosphatase 1
MGNGRTLVIGDIHGGLRALRQVLARAEVTSADLLVFLGDYVDGWSESPAVLDFLQALQQQQRCIFLRGNHDMLLLDWLRNGIENPNWLKHGGRSTLLAYQQLSLAVKHLGRFLSG